jgi:hypothetical protein
MEVTNELHNNYIIKQNNKSVGYAPEAINLYQRINVSNHSNDFIY